MIRRRTATLASQARRVLFCIFCGLLLLSHLPANAQESGAPESWCATSGQQGIPAGECRALEALYRGTGGPQWTDSSGWLSSTAICSAWRGVACRDGHVTELSLAANNLDGPLPAEIGDLAALTSLDLTGNRLSGSIPPAIGALSALNDLSLGANRLEGPIPREISRLRALVALDLGNNLLSGEIPAALGTLPALAEMLYLDGNRLEGPLPAALCQRSYAVASLNYNRLDYFATDEACDTAFPGWQNTQTMGPAGVSVEALSVETETAASAVSGEVLVSWLPVSFAGAGGYEVFSRSLAGGEVQRRARIMDKTADSAQFTIAGDPHAFSYFVRSWSAAHENNQSTLAGDSQDARIHTMPLTPSPPIPGGPLLYVPALALPALLLLGLVATAVFSKQ